MARLSDYEALKSAVSILSSIPNKSEETKALKRLMNKHRPIKLSSAKAKGLSFQRDIRKDLIENVGLDPGDILSTPAGLNGCDIYLSPAARRQWLNAGIECKKQEDRGFRFWKAWEQAETNAQVQKSRPMLVIGKNNSKKLVTIEWEYLLEITGGQNGGKKGNDNSED